MTLPETLSLAGVPEHLHAEALASIAQAEKAKRGLLLHKLKARWLHAGDIADALAWNDERLCIKHPDLCDWDIAPMVNVTAHGDNGPWEIDGSRPKANYWLSQDVTSNEYQTAVASNYWCKGQHPRSKKSVKAWYRRNAGEYLAWRLGAAIDPAKGFEIWRGKDGKNSAVVWRCCGAWIVKSSTHLVGPLYLNSRKGYEVDNVFSGDYSPQMWWPIEGYALRAPVTWSVLPGRAQSMEPKRWEAVRDDGDGTTYTKWRG
jgi:hypothetical protein